MTPSNPVRCLLDTNILMAYVRQSGLEKRIEARYVLNARLATTDAPLISIVTEAELRARAVRRTWGAGKLRMNELLRRCAIVPVDGRDLINAYVQADVFTESIGRPLGSKNDLWIAATAHVTGATLLTSDRDFDPFPASFLLREWIDPTATAL